MYSYLTNLSFHCFRYRALRWMKCWWCGTLKHSWCWAGEWGAGEGGMKGREGWRRGDGGEEREGERGKERERWRDGGEDRVSESVCLFAKREKWGRKRGRKRKEIGKEYKTERKRVPTFKSVLPNRIIAEKSSTIFHMFSTRLTCRLVSHISALSCVI